VTSFKTKPLSDMHTSALCVLYRQKMYSLLAQNDLERGNDLLRYLLVLNASIYVSLWNYRRNYACSLEIWLLNTWKCSYNRNSAEIVFIFVNAVVTATW